MAAASVALAACSSQGGAQNQAPAAGGSGGGDTSGSNLTIQMVTHEQAGDTFWDKIRAGAEDAAKAHGITLQYSNNENGPEQATLVQNAIDSKVSGLAVTLSNADAVIPVVAEGRRGRDPGGGVQPGHRRLQGSRRQDVLRLRRAAGRADRRAAPHRRDRGGKTLCIIQAQGSVALETRCQGVKSAYPNTENLQVNGADLPSVQQTIQSKLAQDPSITNIVDAGRADRARRDAGPGGGGQHRPSSPRSTSTRRPRRRSRTARSCSRSTSSPTCRATWRSTSLWLNLTNGNDIGGGKPMLTGPSIVDSTNIDQILPYTANNKR